MLAKKTHMSLDEGVKWKIGNNLFIIILWETDCIKKRRLVKQIDKVTDKAEKQLYRNKFMKTADVMADFLKRKKARASGLPNLPIMSKLREWVKITL